jgi:hypothetical protein
MRLPSREQSIARSPFESLFSDPFTVHILFRYSTTRPNGAAIAPQNIAESEWVFYTVDWDSYITDLKDGANSRNDAAANATLPSNALSPNIALASANGRAVGIPLDRRCLPMAASNPAVHSMASSR